MIGREEERDMTGNGERRRGRVGDVEEEEQRSPFTWDLGY